MMSTKTNRKLQEGAVRKGGLNSKLTQKGLLQSLHHIQLEQSRIDELLREL